MYNMNQTENENKDLDEIFSIYIKSLRYYG